MAGGVVAAWGGGRLATHCSTAHYHFFLRPLGRRCLVGINRRRAPVRGSSFFFQPK